MLKQSLQQKLLQKLSPQQIQLMKLLQIPTMELEQRIKEELEENPALEEGLEESEDQEQNQEEVDDTLTESEKEIDLEDYINDGDIPDYKTQVSNKGKDDDSYSAPVVSGTSFFEKIMSQLGLRVLSEKQLSLAETLVGNLDESGYLRRDLLSISDDLAFTQNIQASEEELVEVLKVIQDMDPAGVGARDLKECLLLQLYRKDTTEDIALAIEILERTFDAFTKKHYKEIQVKLAISEEQLKDALDEILKLNPKPGGSSEGGAQAASAVTPDFIVVNNEDKLELSLHGRNVPRLKVSRTYKEMMQTYVETKTNKDAVQFVKQKVDAAKWFIDAIQQRNNTLYFTMEAIMNYQREYFLTGDETKLKPMILKDIAEKVELDISTISRVTNSKYVQTEFGTFLLKSFFSESIQTTSGEDVSSIEVKKILEESIASENKKKPLTDEKLGEVLKEKGYSIARRTVAKYREQLNIPVARLRKEL